MTIILGIESTAHTFGIGIVEEKDGEIKFLSNEKDAYKPPKAWGIDPNVCSDHHKDVKNEILKKSLVFAGIKMEDIDAIAYSCGPGLPPCLGVGLEFAKELAEKYSKPIVPVNHCIAHIEIAKHLSGFQDPLVLYVSGANTQIIGYASEKYRIFGETMDIGVGNALDNFARELGLDFPGGPKIDELWKNALERKKYIELPYVVKGMDLSFSGILSASSRLWNSSDKSESFKEDLAFSFSETVFAMLTEVTERALSHTKKKTLILTGGVAASPRLREMLSIMCEQRGVEFYPCDRQYSSDNGLMIAMNGLLMFNSGVSVEPENADFNPNWRSDQVEVSWI